MTKEQIFPTPTIPERQREKEGVKRYQNQSDSYAQQHFILQNKNTNHILSSKTTKEIHYNDS